MLARAYRFHGHNSLRYVYTRGKAIRGAYGVLKVAPNSKRNKYRAAVVVSKKVHKSAVVRNRIRRRVYEIIRHAIPADIPPVDIVFVAYTAQIADIPHEKLQQSLREQLEKSGIPTTDHGIVGKKE